MGACYTFCYILGYTIYYTNYDKFYNTIFRERLTSNNLSWRKNIELYLLGFGGNLETINWESLTTLIRTNS